MRLELAALGVADAVPVRLLGDDPALRPQRLLDRRARREPVEAVELGAAARDAAGLVHDRRHRQAVPSPDLEVVGVVRRGDLERPGAERGVDVLVGHDRDHAPDQRQLDLPADEVPVALVVGVDGDGGVAEHRLDPGGGDDDAVLPVAVADGDQLAVDVLVLDLDVGEHAAHLRRPVDHPLRAVDQPVVVEALEHGEDGAVAALVHREALAAPVDAVAEAAHLGQDRAAVLGLPLPGALDERLAAQLAAVGALGRQRALDERVDGDRGVVHARQPQGVVALHAAAADQDVDQRVLEGVADVQAAGDVGRRDDDAERRLVRRVVGGEVARLDPPVVHARLYRARRPLGRELGGARWEGFGHPPSLRGATDSIFRTAGAPAESRSNPSNPRACCAARGRAEPPGLRRWWARRRARRRRSPTARGSSGAGRTTPTSSGTGRPTASAAFAASMTAVRSAGLRSSTSRTRYGPAPGACLRSHATIPHGEVPRACGQNFVDSLCTWRCRAS